jgi:hypothetical protein
MNASTQPAEGAGGSRSKAAGELTLDLMSGEERGCTPICLCSSVGAGLLAKAACQPIRIWRMYWIPVGAGLLAKAACQPTRIWRMYWIPVGAGLLAKAACQPTRIWRMYWIPVGVSLLAMAAYESTIHLQLSKPIGLSLVGHRSSDGSQTTAGLLPSMHPAKNRGLPNRGCGFPEG